jgi:hypothetical protein
MIVIIQIRLFDELNDLSLSKVLIVSEETRRLVCQHTELSLRYMFIYILPESNIRKRKQE